MCVFLSYLDPKMKALLVAVVVALAIHSVRFNTFCSKGYGQSLQLLLFLRMFSCFRGHASLASLFSDIAETFPK